MTSEQAKESFSLAYDRELDALSQTHFDAALAADAQLAQQYAQFCDTLQAAQRDARVRSDTVMQPDLLRGVQERLRTRSRGRFYADRFAQRSGHGWLEPTRVLAVMVALALLGWAVFALLNGVNLAR